MSGTVGPLLRHRCMTPQSTSPTHLRPVAGLVLALLLVSACGSGTDQLAGTQSPAATASVTPVGAPETPAPSRSPEPTTASSPAPDLTASPEPSVGGGQVTAAPTASKAAATPAASASSGTLLLGDGDDGRTVNLARGQRVEVRLEQGTYDPPDTSNRAVVDRRSRNGGYPSSDPAQGSFEAVGSGRATVSATTDAACLHAQPRCLIAQRTWSVTLVVS